MLSSVTLNYGYYCKYNNLIQIEICEKDDANFADATKQQIERLRCCDGEKIATLSNHYLTKYGKEL